MNFYATLATQRRYAWAESIVSQCLGGIVPPTCFMHTRESRTPRNMCEPLPLCASLSAQVALCKLLGASCSARKLPCASCSAQVELLCASSLRKLLCATFSVHVSLCKWFRASCSAQAALRKFVQGLCMEEPFAMCSGQNTTNKDFLQTFPVDGCLEYKESHVKRA